MASNVPNVTPTVYTQSAPYNAQIPFGHPPPPRAQQQSPTNLSASHPITTVSSPFPQVSLHPTASVATGGALSPHTQLPGNFTPTGSITNSILPASVVDDTSNVPFPGATAADALHNSYAWTDSALTSQPMTSGALAQRMHYSGQIQQHMRQQQQQQSNGLLTSRMTGNNRTDGDNNVANGGVMHSAGFHSQQVNAVGSVLTHVGVGGAFSGMSPLTQPTNQALMPLMGTTSSYSDGDAPTSRHAFQSAQLDIMGGPLRSNVMTKSPGTVTNRIPYDGVGGAFMRNSPLMTPTDLSTAAFGAATAPPPPPPPVSATAPSHTPPISTATGGGTVKAEDSSGPLPRSMKPPRSRSTRSRRKSQPPGTPCVPVHLRNPKKGRDRVFRKCQVCNHDNHIRRSNCDSCKQPLPAGKRKRDGSMSFSKTSHQKQQSTQSSTQSKVNAAVAAAKSQQPQPSPVVITTSARHSVTPLAPAAHPTTLSMNNPIPPTSGGGGMDSTSSGGTASGAGAASSLASAEGMRGN